MAKEIKVMKCKIEERISKAGKAYMVLMADVNGVWKDICFVSKDMEFALYKAGIKL